MGKRRKRKIGNRRVRIALLALVLVPIETYGGEPGQPIRFSELEVIREIAPMFPLSTGRDPAGKGIEKGRHLEEKDLLARTKKRCRIVQEPWPLDADIPEGATLTAFYDLVENAGLSFGLTTEASGTHSVEILAPRAPDLGSFAIRIGEGKAGVLDPWASDRELSTWRRLPNPINLISGQNRIDLLQLSPTDSPIYLRAIRFVPVGEVPGDSSENSHLPGEPLGGEAERHGE